MSQNENDHEARLSPWAQWTLRGLYQLGGTSTPRAVDQHVAKQLVGTLTAGQIARVLKNNYLRWGSHDLRKARLLGGEYGTWVLTPAGKLLAEQKLSEVIAVPTDIEELPANLAGYDGPTETVPVTSFEAYRIPILRALREGPRPKQDLMNLVGADLTPMLRAGDLRLMPNGTEVWRFRASWTLTDLKKVGLIRNDAQAVWELTETGRAQLQNDAPSWSIVPYQAKAKATVRAVTVGVGKVIDNVEPPEIWPTDAWLALGRKLTEPVLDSIARRIRPDLGPTPDIARGSLPRNLVLYGPPGTGKTHVASLIASALTEEEQRTPEGAWRLVQFHPSYSYEDFVQGMRPDLEQQQLRYTMRKGPFLALCEAAEEDPDNFYVLVIDEINRGDPARIFGELLYALEYRGEPVDLALGGQLVVPPNVVVIGTMNSVDRSVALVDYALRRRFAFVRLDPEPTVITRVRGEGTGAKAAAHALAELNAWLTKRLDREHAVGHSFFLNPALDLDAPDALHGAWREDLLPLLEEYFVGDADGLEEAQQKWSAILAALPS